MVASKYQQQFKCLQMGSQWGIMPLVAALVTPPGSLCHMHRADDQTHIASLSIILTGKLEAQTLLSVYQVNGHSTEEQSISNQTTKQNNDKWLYQSVSFVLFFFFWKTGHIVGYLFCLSPFCLTPL